MNAEIWFVKSDVWASGIATVGYWIRAFSALVVVLVFAACDGSTVELPERDSDLLLPWSQLKGRIAIYYVTDGSRRTLVINSERRTVTYMGDFGTYLGGFDLSPDGRTIALAYALGSGYGNFNGIRLVSSASASVGRWDNGESASDYRGYAPRWRPDSQLSYWRADTLFTGPSATAALKAPQGSYSWPANNSHIFLSYWDDVRRTQGVFAFRVSDRTLVELIAGEPGVYWWSPAVAGTGNLMAVKRSTTAQAGHGIGELWLANADGSGRRLLNSTVAGVFDWSPDGSELIVAGSSENCANCPPVLAPGVYLLRIADGSLRKLMDIHALDVSWGK